VDESYPQGSHIDNMTTITVWHDGTCPLCRREIALMRRLDTRGAIRFVDATTAGSAPCPVDRSALLARFHAEENGQLLAGAAAFAAMWCAIPLLRPLGLAACSPLISRLFEISYRGFLVVRPILQRAVRRGSPT
jgi:predicted DCC family thiol-disulfide oxidoreductase YuxK